MTDPNKDSDQDKTAPESTDVDWDSAFAEQSAGSTPPSQADGLESDDWASALAEQTASANVAPTAPEQAPEPALTPAANVFQPLTGADFDGESDIDLIMDIPVQLSVELGRTRLTIKNSLQLGQGSVVELDGLAGEPMDIFVNGYLIAQGEVVVVEDKYGIRLTDIITPSDRLSRLNSRR